METGANASLSVVVRADPRALLERDSAVERWLRDEVGPVNDAMQADPERGIRAKASLAAVHAHHTARLKKADRDV